MVDLRKHALSEQWEQDFGEHEECPVCGTNCRDHFLDTSPSEEQVRELVQAAREMCCWVGHETFPNSFNADISRLHRALEPFTQV